jgi:hypothetical protein
MSNIPLLNKQQNAQAQTQVVDRSKLVNAQQAGVKEFGNNIQKILKNTTELVDTKIYESESANAQKEILGFMSESNSEKDKSDYFKRNNTMAGFHTHQAKRNLDNIERRLSKISHPKARKELESKLVFQAQKSMLGDLSDENRSLKVETNLKEQDKNHILGVEIMGMKSPDNDVEFGASVQTRINDIDKQVSDGFIQGATAQKFKIDVKDTANTLRARALIEGGNPLSAIKHVKTGDFGTLAARMKAESYVKSKQLDGIEKGYKAQKAQNNYIKAQDEAITLEIDTKIQSIHLNEGLSDIDKIEATNELRNQYKNKINSKHFRLFNNANIIASRNMVNGVMATVNNIPMDQTETRTFRNAIDSLRGLATNPDVPSNIAKQATVAMNTITKKQKAHEKIVEKDAYKELTSSPRGKRIHNKILKTISTEAKYKDLPVEGRIEIYELLRDGKDKKYLKLNSKKLQAADSNIIDKPFEVDGKQALDKFNKDPKKFEALIKRAIKRKKYNGFFSSRHVSDREADKLYSQFKESFDDYRQKVDSFETLESQILNKYNTRKVADR